MIDTSRPLVAVISATPAAIPPAREAFAKEFPEARLWNILDDRLLEEAENSGGLTPALHERMGRLIRHAVAEGAAGVLLSCSMYGQVARAAAAELPIPVLAADDAAFTACIEAGHRRVLVLASLPAALEDTLARLEAFASFRGIPPRLHGLAIEEAKAASAGPPEALSHILASAARAAAAEADAILLAQYSLSPAADALSAELGLPVLAGPVLTAQQLRRSLQLEVGS